MEYKFFIKKKVILILSLVTILLFTTSCEEDPIAPQEEHVEAVGMVFYSSGAEIARTYAGETESKFFVPVGGLSDHIDIKFINEDGDEFTVDEEDTQTLAWEFDDPTIADIWQHEGEEGAFEFHLQGLIVGETNIEFFVMHNDHSDFRSGKIPVKVANNDSSYGVPIGLEVSDEESGNILASINNTQVVGQLNVNNSDTTNHLEVEFFDAQNIHFQPAVPPHSLLVEVADESIIGIAGLEEDEPWAFKLVGLKTGSTSITIKIIHDGNVGVTFEPLTVNVN